MRLLLRILSLLTWRLGRLGRRCDNCWGADPSENPIDIGYPACDLYFNKRTCGEWEPKKVLDKN